MGILTLELDNVLEIWKSTRIFDVSAALLLNSIQKGFMKLFTKFVVKIVLRYY